MNINKELFENSQTGLFETIDTARPLCDTQRKEVEYYTVEYCTKAIIDFYKAKENSEKTPQKLMTAIFNAGIFTRFLFDNFADNTEERNKEIITFLSGFGLWEQTYGWMENRLADIEECEKYNNYLELTVSDMCYLTYQKSIVIGDNGNLKDMLTVLYSIFIFACCLQLKFK